MQFLKGFIFLLSQYEAELNQLRQQLAETQKMLADTQERLLTSDPSPRMTSDPSPQREGDGSDAWVRKYSDADERYRKETQAKDDHIKALNHRYVAQYLL